ALFVLAQRHGRQALFLSLLAMYLGGTTAIAFLPRHRWHLYFIGFLTLAVSLKFVVDLVRGRATVRLSPAAMRAIVVLLVVGLASVAASRVYQDRVVSGMAEQVLAAGATPLTLEWK